MLCTKQKVLRRFWYATLPIHKLEDEILEAMGELEDKTKLIPEAEQALHKAKADAVQFGKDHQAVRHQ